MAWFDFGAGLAEMGKQVAQTSGVAMLEQMKAQNEEARIKLADELATARESKGRQETHSLDMQKLDKVQTFTAGENKADRENREKVAGIGAAASIYSANATLQAAREGIAARKEESNADRTWKTQENEKDRDFRTKDRDATLKNHLDGIQMQIDALKPERDATVAARNIETQAKKMVVEARTELQAAMDAGDQQAILKAKNKVAAAEFSAGDEAKIATLQGNALKVAENDLSSARSKLADFTSKNSLGIETPQTKQVQEQLQKAVDDAEREYKAQAQKFKSMIDNLIMPGMNTGQRRDLGSLPGAPAPGARPAGNGLVNNPAGGPR